MTTVLCVPQWQGSGSRQAPRLVRGAHGAAELVAADSLVAVPVLAEGGEYGDGIRALDVLAENLRLTRNALADIDDQVITVGGDCAVDLAPIEAARDRYGDALTVLWVDAHPDLNDLRTLPSGSFHGMVLRTLLGEGPAVLVPERPLTREQVRIGGVRSFQPGEREYLEGSGLIWCGVDGLAEMVGGLTGPVYAHIDLDVLEPSAFGSTCYPEADGVSPDALIELLSQLDNVVGAALTEHAPLVDTLDGGEAEIIRRLGAALSR